MNISLLFHRIFYWGNHPLFPGSVVLSRFIAALLLFALLFSATASNSLPRTQIPYIINNKHYYPIPSAAGFNQQGIASWYGKDFHGQRTSNGEMYNMYALTAAHKTLPMDTMVLVKNLHNNKTIVVRINDRGPFVQGRIIDLSYTAAERLELIGHGTAKVAVTALTENELTYPDLSSGEFYVQIGAFAEKINAIKLQRRFTDAGHTTVIQKCYEPQAILYRVQVYAGKTLDNAEQAEKALLGSGYTGSFIIAR